MVQEHPRFRVVDASASAEEVAAIVAALTVLTPAGAVGNAGEAESSRWIMAGRLASRRSGLSRGDWRLSGRIGRRARA
jgi:hypothetical protein